MTTTPCGLAHIEVVVRAIELIGTGHAPSLPHSRSRHEVPSVNVRAADGIAIEDHRARTRDGGRGVEAGSRAVFIIQTAVEDHGSTQHLMEADITLGPLVRKLKAEVLVVQLTPPIHGSGAILTCQRQGAVAVLVVGIQVRRIEDLTVTRQTDMAVVGGGVGRAIRTDHGPGEVVIGRDEGSGFVGVKTTRSGSGGRIIHDPEIAAGHVQTTCGIPLLVGIHIDLIIARHDEAEGMIGIQLTQGHLIPTCAMHAGDGWISVNGVGDVAVRQIPHLAEQVDRSCFGNGGCDGERVIEGIRIRRRRAGGWIHIDVAHDGKCRVVSCRNDHLIAVRRASPVQVVNDDVPTPSRVTSRLRPQSHPTGVLRLSSNIHASDVHTIVEEEVALAGKHHLIDAIERLTVAQDQTALTGDISVTSSSEAVGIIQKEAVAARLDQTIRVDD